MAHIFDNKILVFGDYGTALSHFCLLSFAHDCDCALLIINDPLLPLRAGMITFNDCDFTEDCLGLKRQLKPCPFISDLASHGVLWFLMMFDYDVMFVMSNSEF